MSMATLAKRLFRLPLKHNDIYRPIEALIADLSWMERHGPGWMRDYLVSNRFSDGLRYDEKWKSDFAYVIDEIAQEPTWLLQRKRLLQFCVNANSWIALKNVVTTSFADDVLIWENVVSKNDAFSNNDKSLWTRILLREGIFSTVTYAILSVTASPCYGVSNIDMEKMTFFRELREYAYNNQFSTLRGFFALVEADRDSGLTMFKLFQERAIPFWNMTDKYFRELAEDISLLKPVDKYAEQWETLSNQYNAELNRLASELT